MKNIINVTEKNLRKIFALFIITPSFDNYFHSEIISNSLQRKVKVVLSFR